MSGEVPVPSPLPEISRWQDLAACRGMDPNIFFPELGESVEPAKAICAKCPVAPDCLEYALTLADVYPGIWGGTSARQRRIMRSRSA